MFFDGKKIIYLNVYDKEKRKHPAGFVRCIKEKETYVLEVHLQRLQNWQEGKYSVFLESSDKEVLLGEVRIKNGEGNERFDIRAEGEALNVTKSQEPDCDFYAIKIPGKEDEIVIGGRKGEDGQSICPKQPEIKEVWENCEKSQHENAEWVEDYEEDKWRQLLRSYPQVHPFRDERVFIVIEPKDFIILNSSCQKLVNNSFLLHGFYNYRHMILGFCSGISACEGYYLGVPGTFYEREKMIAVMFGFEGFECSGPVENGKFGYYMKRVEL